MAELFNLSASEMAAQLEAGEVSSEALVEAHIARARLIDGRINAFVQRFDDRARAHARESDARRRRGEARGPLDGMPITVKESIAIAGTASTLGVPRNASRMAPSDGVVVRLLADSGAVILGKTNVSQLLMFHESDNPVFGRTHNPWNLGRVPGGSSGGEGAAIASGSSPWGVGTDIGGSIRVPAAFCGICGLKPTVDRWSNQGSYGALMGQEIVRGQSGPMARRAADVATLFRALDSPRHAAHDPGVPPLPTPDPGDVDVSGLRIGWFEDDGFLGASAPVARAVRDARDSLESLGAELVRFTPPAAEELLMTYFGALSSDGGVTASEQLGPDREVEQLRTLFTTARLPALVRRAAARVMGLTHEHRVSKMLQVIGTKPVSAYWKLAHRRTDIRRRVSEAWTREGLDAVICPPHATVALGHGQSRDFSIGGSYAMRYNFLDFPAGVVPVGKVRPQDAPRAAQRDRFDKIAAEVEADSAGLPTAVQIVGRPWREDVVLALMVALDEALDGEDRPRTPIGPDV